MTLRLHLRPWLLVLLPFAAPLLLTSCCDDDDDCWDDDDVDCHSHTSDVGTVFIHCHDDDDDFFDDENDDDFDDDDDHNFLAGGGGAEVTVLATDSPLDGLRALRVTVARLELVGEPPDPVLLYDSAEGLRLDLLALRGSDAGGGRDATRLYEFLCGRRPVPAAAYGELRILLVDPEIVLASGEKLGAERIDLEGGGALELELREPVLAGPADVVYLLLDFDLERSLEPLGGGARWRLRPHVVPEVAREDVGERVAAPADVAGTVLAVDPQLGTLSVELSGGRGAFPVAVAKSTAAFDAVLEPLNLAALHPGDAVSARGVLGADGLLAARSLVAAATEALRGTIAAVGGGAALELALELETESARVAPRVEVVVAPWAEVTLRRRTRVPAGALAPGRKVTATVLSLGTRAAVAPEAALDGESLTAVRVDLDPESFPLPRP
jgi:hypothetical protein